MTKKPQTLAERLLGKLVKLGVTERKAKGLAKGLVATASRVPVKGTVTSKLEARLEKLGLSERKAKELAKGLAPLVRSSIKAKVRKSAKKLDDVTDDEVEDTVAEAVDGAEDPELDKVAPRVDGHRVRLDLAVVGRSEWQRKPIKGVELLRVIDGLTTTATYLVSAVKGETAMVAVRQFSDNHFNVKFYPNMTHWSKTRSELEQLGGYDFLTREWYQRCHTNRDGLERILHQLAIDAKPKSRMKQLVDWFLTVTAGSLVKAFGYLQRSKVAAA